MTGGGPGLMEAANVGAKEGSPDSKSFGLHIDLPFETTPNEHLDVTFHHKKFSSRLDEFMRISHAVVVTPGGIGTILELMYAWQFSGLASENDLYASYALGDHSVTLTDYYFPGTDFNETDAETGSHNIELSLGGAFSGIGFTTAMFLVEPGFYGAFKDGEIPMSKYISLSYGPFILELGDGGYTSDGEFNAVGIGVTASNDKYSCTWTLNPDSGQAYLVATMGL